MKKLLPLITAVLLSVTAYSQNVIVTDSILQLSTCAGGDVLVRFNATGNYNAGNQFIAQLSNSLGQFTSPVDIGHTSFNLGFILATIPQSANFGFLYKIRVVATNPAVIGSSCPNTLIVTQVAQLNQIIPFPNDTLCMGDSITLTALNLASSYLWSTGDTTQTITIKQSGTYSVTTTDFLTCKSSTDISIAAITCNTGIEEAMMSHSLSVHPNPASGNIYIENIDDSNQNKYKIYTCIGQLAKQGTLAGNQIEITDLQNGLYFIIVSTHKEYYLARFIKQ